MKELTNENYFQDDEYFSVSTYKKYKYCEFLGSKGTYDNNKPTDSMLMSSYVDAYVEGTVEQFKEEHPEIFSSRGATKGELKADYKLAQQICEYIDGNERIQAYLSGEKQTILTGHIGGVPFKIKMDSYLKDKAIVDLKVMATLRDSQGNFKDFIGQYEYDIQMACYQEVEYQNSGKRLPCYILAVSKENPIDSVIIHIPQVYLDMALARVTEDIAHFYDIKMGKQQPIRCEKCKMCISTKGVTELISYDDIVNGGQ